MNFWLLKYRIKRMLTPTRITSAEYLKYLRINGIEIGGGTFFFFPCSNTIDIQRPWMLKIGKYCKITEGVTILTHDYSRSVLRMKYGEVIGEARVTTIGNNVFIGVKTTILMGANIGNNVIIGAGSVVSGTIPDNTVAAGVPAKVVCSLDEYYAKRKKRTLEEAVLYTKNFIQFMHRKPSVSEMGPFFPLFLERSNDALLDNHVRTRLSGDSESDLVEKFLQSKPMFNSLDEFLQYVNQN